MTANARIQALEKADKGEQLGQLHIISSVGISPDLNLTAPAKVVQINAPERIQFLLRLKFSSERLKTIL